jgi:GrpB-like predicted nucleotidyltransferase (UPF0157 family)
MSPGPRIVIAPYDPAWPRAFEAEAFRIRSALGPLALRIEHNGSTSVPGLAAKPIIDIQVSVASLTPIEAYRAPLHAIGYFHEPQADDAFCPFFRRPREWPHTHHVHVVEAGGSEERRTLAFRDYLRKSDGAAREYERLKRQLAAMIPGASAAERETYVNGKSHFIEAAISQALADGLPSGLPPAR